VTEPRERDTTQRRWMWKVVSAISGMLSALIAKKLIRSVYRAVRKDDPASAFDPTAERFSWPNALLWAIASGVGLAIAKVVGDRLAAIGWKAATGALPPGSVEKSVIG
jgi:hypothetical protein